MALRIALDVFVESLHPPSTNHCAWDNWTSRKMGQNKKKTDCKYKCCTHHPSGASAPYG